MLPCPNCATCACTYVHTSAHLFPLSYMHIQFFFKKKSNNKFLSCSETIRVPATKTHIPGDKLPAHKYTQSQIHLVGSNQHSQCSLHHVNMMVCPNRWCHNILPRDSIFHSLVSQSAPTFSHRWDLGSVQAMSSYLLCASPQVRQKLAIHLFRREKNTMCYLPNYWRGKVNKNWKLLLILMVVQTIIFD